MFVAEKLDSDCVCHVDGKGDDDKNDGQTKRLVYALTLAVAVTDATLLSKTFLIPFDVKSYYKKYISTNWLLDILMKQILE